MSVLRTVLHVDHYVTDPLLHLHVHVYLYECTYMHMCVWGMGEMVGGIE